jgi:sn-glycerol 3-phosphate transport system substrate-binding protein
VAGYYTAPNGQMLSFPFNSSTTVFYYNKDAFKAAGLDPDKPQDLARSGAGRRQAQGQRPQVPVHHQLAELDAARELLAWHNVAVRHQEQRLWRHGCALKINSPLHVRHIENLANMAKQGLFVYKGRNNNVPTHPSCPVSAR